MRFLIFISLLSSFAFAQTDTTQAPETPTVKIKTPLKVPYQLYFKDKVEKVTKVEYMDGTPIRHQLDADGETLILFEYTKRGRVKIFTEDAQGEPTVIERSPCYIDPVMDI